MASAGGPPQGLQASEFRRGPRWQEIYDRSLDCVHCGLCLPVCPTYRITGRETSSPRGRLYLIRGTFEGEIPVGEVLAEEAYLCLGCRACETADNGSDCGVALVITARHSADASADNRAASGRSKRSV